MTNACARTTVRSMPRSAASSRIRAVAAVSTAHASARAELGHDRVGQQVGDAVDGHLAMLVASSTGRAMSASRGAQVDAGRLAEPGAEPEPDRRVVVAAGQHHRNAVRGRSSQQGPARAAATASAGGTARSYTSPGHQHRVRLVPPACAEQPVQERSWWPSRFSPCSVRPRCQSEVWISRIAARTASDPGGRPTGGGFQLTPMMPDGSGIPGDPGSARVSRGASGRAG